MDHEKMIFENLDSLWFFSNVLSQSPPPPQPTDPLNSDLVVPPEILVDHKESEQQEMRKPKGLEVHSKDERRRRSGKICEGAMKEAAELICMISALVKDHPVSHCRGESAMKEHLKSWAHAVAYTVRC